MATRNFVSFKSTAFEDEGSGSTDNGHFAGRALSEYLVAQLKNSGLEALEPCLDDFAWTFDVKVGARTFWMHVGESEDEKDKLWLVIANSTLGFFRRWRGQSDEKEMRQLCQQLHRILVADGRVDDVNWYTEEQWNRSPDQGAATPD